VRSRLSFVDRSSDFLSRRVGNSRFAVIVLRPPVARSQDCVAKSIACSYGNVSASSVSFSVKGPDGNTVLGGVGSIEGNLSDGGRIICGGCAGSDDGKGETRGGGVIWLSEAEGGTGESDGVGVRGASGTEAEEGIGAAKDLTSLSSEDTESSSGVDGIGDAGETIRGRRGTFVGYCEYCECWSSDVDTTMLRQGTFHHTCSI
jgi:hypothetical protein